MLMSLTLDAHKRYLKDAFCTALGQVGRGEAYAASELQLDDTTWATLSPLALPAASLELGRRCEASVKEQEQRMDASSIASPPSASAALAAQDGACVSGLAALAESSPATYPHKRMRASDGRTRRRSPRLLQQEQQHAQERPQQEQQQQGDPREPLSPYLSNMPRAQLPCGPLDGKATIQSA